jgi:hypothetical protein
MDLKHALLADIKQLENNNSGPVIVWCSRESNGKMITDVDVRAIYKCVSLMPSAKKLNLVLHTDGGLLTSAAKIAALIREFCVELNVIIPYKARSAGTLLCLAANTISMGRCAEISPIDPISRGKPSPDCPEGISSEDVRCFGSMIREWFSLETDQHRLEALGILSQKIFPTSLTGLFRADKYVRQLASRLLSYNLTDADQPKKDNIIKMLMEGYFDHLHGITRREAIDAGLNISKLTTNDETIANRILETAWQRMASLSNEESNTDVNSLIICNEVELVFSMQYSAVDLKAGENFQPRRQIMSKWIELA